MTDYQTFSFESIELEIDPRGVASLWLDRPEKNNAFNAQTIAELIQALDTVANDDRRSASWCCAAVAGTSAAVPTWPGCRSP